MALSPVKQEIEHVLSQDEMQQQSTLSQKELGASKSLLG